MRCPLLMNIYVWCVCVWCVFVFVFVRVLCVFVCVCVCVCECETQKEPYDAKSGSPPFLHDTGVLFFPRHGRVYLGGEIVQNADSQVMHPIIMLPARGTGGGERMQRSGGEETRAKRKAQQSYRGWLGSALG